MKLTKSLADLDAAADELLAKSIKDAEKQDTDTEVSPEEISDDSVTPTEDAENAETDKEEKEEESKEEKEDVKKSEDDADLKKADEEETPADATLEKSEEAQEEDSTEKSAEEIEKSLKEDFEAEEVIQKSIDGSEFFSAVVDIFAKSMGDMQYDQQNYAKQNTQATEVLAKSLQAVMSANQTLRQDNEKLTRRINKLEKSITQGFEQVMDSLDTIGSQPAHMRKSMAAVNVHDRDFDRSVNGVQTVGGFETLSKSQVLDVLTNEMYSGNQKVTSSDIISYESGAPLRQDLQSLVASKVNR